MSDWLENSRQFSGVYFPLTLRSGWKLNPQRSWLILTMSVISEDRVRGGMFKEISADEEDALPTELESLCMSCYQNVSDNNKHRDKH